MEEVNRYYNNPISLADAEQYIAASFMTTAREYVAIGHWMRRIRDDKLFLEEGYKNFEEYVRHKYHRDPGWASNCIKVNKKFSIDGNSPYLAEQYRDYNKSQLVELAYMTEEQRMEAGPDMSVKAMKEMRKQEQAETKKVVTSQLSDQTSSAPELTDQTTAKAQQEELTPIERGCITGLSPHGNCVCCGADGVKCCGQCDKDCNGRCGWLDEQETEQPVPKMEYELRGKYCDAAARKLIESKHEWFAADHMNRVLQVNESEKQLKEQLVGKEAWYFMDPYGNGIAHMNLFQDYIQFFDGNSWVGECEWFYLCAAIQGMWNVIVIEKAQAEQPAPMGPGKEEKLPDESWNIGELPQAKEKHLKQLAKKLVERLGSKIVLDEMSSIPSEETIEKATWQLGRMEPGGIELQDGAVAYACQGIIEFFRGEEDLGVCSYARFATQARKALSEWSDQVPGESQEAEPEEDEQKPEVIDAEFSEVNELGDDYLTDLQIAQRELERANRLLEKCLRGLPDETNISIRGMKLKVAALASFICDLDDIENPPPKPEQPELPILKNNDQRAAFVDAYESWPIWIETEETGERYYRYDLQDGTSMVVKVYHAMLFDYNHTFDGKWEDRFTEGYGRHEYYLLEPGKFFRNCETNRSALIDKLKEIQKKG